jgi:hypothetical protein
MCGRFALYALAARIREQFELDDGFDSFDFVPPLQHRPDDAGAGHWSGIGGQACGQSSTLGTDSGLGEG